MGVIVNGALEEVPGLRILSAFDDPVFHLGREDMRHRRTSWVRSIFLHTTKGIPGGKDHRPQLIKPGLGPLSTNAERVGRYWTSDPSSAGAHIVGDHDAHFVCFADLLLDCTYHATSVNDVSIGIEIYQGSEAELYEDQLAAVVKLVDWLTLRFGVQRQFHKPYRNGHCVKRLNDGGTDCVGVFGHRDQTDGRGPGDPGDRIFELLEEAGYEPFDFAAGLDLETWKERQEGVGIEADGIPGPGTREALTNAGYAGGLWVSRPGDQP